MSQNAILVLEDGRSFVGTAYGARGSAVGPISFSTAVTGYQEMFTDPDRQGQILAMTAPHIGNTGVSAEAAMSPEYQVAGVVVRDPSRVASSWTSQGELEPALAEAGVVGIAEVDTRALMRHLRDTEVTHAGIFSSENLPLGATDKDPAAIASLVAIVSERTSR